MIKVLYLGLMFISYFDESGDDGFPNYSSELFVLSSLYMPYFHWQDNYNTVHAFRKFLKASYGMPVKQEFHTKEFIAGKHPYNGQYDFKQRKEILTHFCKMLPTLKVKCISVVIDKTKIKRTAYSVLENALTYNVQRIENDLNKNHKAEKFMIITDEGRVGKMRNVTRKIQQINYIPSIYNPDPYRKEIKNLIEDPLPKTSDQSHFIQLADVLSFVVSLYAKRNLCEPKIEWAARVKTVLNYGDEVLLMDAIKGALNTRASQSNPYGIVYYPK
jgi:hypothetical protein